MIYATTVVGKEFLKGYSEQVNKEGSSVKLFVQTDEPNLFPSCTTTTYHKPIFSYYDKITFLLETVLKVKERVTFVDADWCSNLNPNSELSDDILYTWNLYEFKDIELLQVYKAGKLMSNRVLKENNLPANENAFLGERLLSFPYIGTDKIKTMLSQLYDLQPKWEEAFSQSIRLDLKLKKYASVGVGYCEGGALLGIVENNSVNYAQIPKEFFIKKSLF
jgi:hypothetical protein